jgi:hypothetical protein
MLSHTMGGLVARPYQNVPTQTGGHRFDSHGNHTIFPKLLTNVMVPGGPFLGFHMAPLHWLVVWEFFYGFHWIRTRDLQSGSERFGRAGLLSRPWCGCMQTPLFFHLSERMSMHMLTLIHMRV